MLLSTLGRLFTNYLQSIHGFTCGIDDMILTKNIEVKRRDLIAGSYDAVVESVSRFADLKKKKPDIDKLRRAVQTKLRVPDNLKLLDQAVMGTVHPLSSKILELCLPAGQVNGVPHPRIASPAALLPAAACLLQLHRLPYFWGPATGAHLARSSE